MLPMSCQRVDIEYTDALLVMVKCENDDEENCQLCPALPSCKCFVEGGIDGANFQLHRALTHTPCALSSTSEEFGNTSLLGEPPQKKKPRSM